MANSERKAQLTLREMNTRLLAQLKTTEQERDALRQEIVQLKKMLDDAAGRELALQQQTNSTETLAAIHTAISVLQRTLPPTAPATKPTNSPQRPPAPPEPRVVKPVIPDTVINLPHGRGQRQYHSTTVRDALTRNTESLINEVREGLAQLAQEPAKESTAITAFAKAGIPRAVLTAPLRSAVVDGSNIANMSDGRRARLDYLTQIRHSAWEEGYFPVEIIIDASLPYQVDHPDRLQVMIERGEIRQAPAGTSADELLIEEAQRRHAVIITNDRLQEWPAAKSLEKRHAELHGGKVRLGSFHTSSWFR